MDRFDQLAPRDIAITLRSLRRRFGPAKHAASTSELAPLAETPGPAGSSLTHVLTNAGRGASLVANEVVRSLDHDEPVIPAAVLDPSERAFTEDRMWSIDRAVDLLADEAERAADRIERASADDLSRSVAVAGGGTTSPLALAQLLARETVTALRQAEVQLEWMRSQT